ncbi:MAG: hypothetical protein P8Z78_14940 [Gammaproteobacteria bacterium]|jgi:hypothetical protein
MGGNVAITVNDWDPKSSDEVRFWLYVGKNKVAEKSFRFNIAQVP